MKRRCVSNDYKIWTDSGLSQFFFRTNRYTESSKSTTHYFKSGHDRQVLRLNLRNSANILSCPKYRETFRSDSGGPFTSPSRLESRCTKRFESRYPLSKPPWPKSCYAKRSDSNCVLLRAVTTENSLNYAYRPRFSISISPTTGRSYSYILRPMNLSSLLQLP